MFSSSWICEILILVLSDGSVAEINILHILQFWKVFKIFEISEAKT